ncbi:MAG: immunoglobulin-like domain-containing protein [Clostridium sp.]|uniref:immunoglobulin-like domain-containing protein n=1 Tax=Clostridium sp. TaxID=1506 RepID=UPI003F312740
MPNNSAPVLEGVENKTIKLNSSFDKMAGVKATDKEDGDLTSKIKVTGDVDTTKAGTYNLTYEVADKEGLKATAKRVITVKENAPVVDEKPVITGVKNRTIKLNSSFDKMAGITANDKEDGVLTNKIKVDGEVDTTKAGNYILTYSVTDSKGQTTTESCVITVEGEKPPVPGDTYDANKIYNAGDKVIYKGKEYTAKWWVRGEAPDKSSAWEVTPEIGADGVEVYVPGKAYNGGTVVSYNGAKYKAKWWTNTTPGSDDSWSKL